jgi:hypothetical protein
MCVLVYIACSSTDIGCAWCGHRQRAARPANRVGMHGRSERRREHTQWEASHEEGMRRLNGKSVLDEDATATVEAGKGPGANGFSRESHVPDESSLSRDARSSCIVNGRSGIGACAGIVALLGRTGVEEGSGVCGIGSHTERDSSGERSGAGAPTGTVPSQSTIWANDGNVGGSCGSMSWFGQSGGSREGSGCGRGGGPS